jgi:hypothetical protein
MSEVADAHHHLQVAFEALRAAAESPLTTDDELISVLTMAEGISRQLEHLTVSTVAVLQPEPSCVNSSLRLDCADPGRVAGVHPTPLGGSGPDTPA